MLRVFGRIRLFGLAQQLLDLGLQLRDFLLHALTPEKKQDNFTDPESRIMKTSSGYEQCYNGQIAVDAESRLIVAAEVTQSAADVEQLLPMVEQTCAVTQGVPSEVLADAGYRSEDNLQGLEGKA